jgi:large subunit ribosomal protein L32e
MKVEKSLKKIKEIRAKMKARMPKFLRQEWFKYPSLGLKWRAPKGNQSKLRRGFKAKGWMPNPGYRMPVSLRNLHPSGLSVVYVENPKQVEGLNKEKHAIMIRGSVGKKKRTEIIAAAQRAQIRVLNPGKALKIEAKNEQKQNSQSVK